MRVGKAHGIDHSSATVVRHRLQPHPYFLHVAGSDDTTCDFHIEWGFAELYVDADGSFHLLADDDVDIEGPEALPKLREILDARKR